MEDENGWIKEQEEKLKKQLAKQAEDSMFTAQKGSTLDKIWNKKWIDFEEWKANGGKTK